MAREMVVVPYDEIWVCLYEREKELLLSIFSDLVIDIHHFGSTSIHGMSAKPIIDIMVIVKDISMIDKFNEKMIEHGYEPRGEHGVPKRRYFVRFTNDGENHSHHTHIYENNDCNAVDQLVFRDFLMIDRESFLEYKSVKLQAAEKYRFSPKEYTDAKTECVTRIMDKAKSYHNAQKKGPSYA